MDGEAAINILKNYAISWRRVELESHGCAMREAKDLRRNPRGHWECQTPRFQIPDQSLFTAILMVCTRPHTRPALNFESIADHHKNWNVVRTEDALVVDAGMPQELIDVLERITKLPIQGGT